MTLAQHLHNSAIHNKGFDKNCPICQTLYQYVFQQGLEAHKQGRSTLWNPYLPVYHEMEYDAWLKVWMSFTQ